MILEYAVGPDAEAGTLRRFDSVTDRNDDVEAVVLNFARHMTAPLLANYPEIPDSCRRLQFAFGVYVTDVLVDSSYILVEQLRHLPLSQPDGLPFQSYLGDGFSFALVDQYRQRLLQDVHVVVLP
ncbi:hypothetical protein D3C76_1142270 [compost metagenome]